MIKTFRKPSMLLMSAIWTLSVILVVLWFWFSPPPSPTVKPLAIVGVGLYVARNEAGKFQITRIFPNSPAEKAGLAPGVLLNKVNGVLVEEKEIDQLPKLLIGPLGSKVVLETIDDGGNTNRVELVREQFVNHSTR